MGFHGRLVLLIASNLKMSDFVDNGVMRRGMATIKGYARPAYEANFGSILAIRLTPSPMIRLSCGNQSAHIRLINRRRNIPLLLFSVVRGIGREEKDTFHP